MPDPAAPSGPLPLRTFPVAPRTIAIDLDDTLNDFTATLTRTSFPYDPAYALTEPVFQRYLASVRRNLPEPGDLLSTEYSYFRYKIHQQCYGLARARPDGIEFMQWLRREGWRIVICTHRDLRRAHDCTRTWLAVHAIPFDHLFMALNKIVFCKAWGIAHLIDDDPFYLAHGSTYGVQVYHPILPLHHALPAHSARGFHSFSEVKSWIQE